MTTKLSKLDLHLRSRRHSLYFCVFGKEKPQCPSTLHGHYTEVTQRVLYFSRFSIFSHRCLLQERKQRSQERMKKKKKKGNACLSIVPVVFAAALSLGFVNFREGSETFGGLSGMLRQILSPSPETGDTCLPVTCTLLQNNTMFSNQSSMMSSTYQTVPSHLPSICSDQILMDHVQIVTESHPCSTCGLEFRSALKLNYHIRTSHSALPEFEHNIENNPMRYSCTICSRSFFALSHLRMHEVTHSAPPATSCAPMPTISTSVNVDKTFACDRCQASFRYRTLFERHRRMHEVGQEKPYSCPRCLMRFETRNLYNHHAKTHKPGNDNRITDTVVVSSGDPVTSSISGTIASTNKSVLSYPCDSCSKQFASIESLTTHKAVHRSRPLVCDVCGKGFTHRKYYVVHQRIHTGERPYLCAMCGKSFTQASTLTVHRRYHTGERPYTCTLCGKGFVTRTIMLNHMKKH